MVGKMHVEKRACCDRGMYRIWLLITEIMEVTEVR